METNVTFKVIYQIGDVNPPLLTIDTPRNSQTSTSSSITVSGTATDAGQGGHGVAQVTVNGVPADGGTAADPATANWSRTVNLLPGVNVIAGMLRIWRRRRCRGHLLCGGFHQRPRLLRR